MDRIYAVFTPSSARECLVHMPPNWSGSGLNVKKRPLVIALHGGMSSGPAFQAQTGFDALADQLDWIVAYPQGHGAAMTGHGTWNAGACCGMAQKQGIDDVAFVDKLINDLSLRTNIDKGRVYVVGWSNGAMLAERLACDLPTRIQAIACVSGDMLLNSPQPFSGRLMPVMHIHGALDTHVPFDGGIGPNSFDKCNHKSILDGCDFWGKWNGATASEVTPSPQLETTQWKLASGKAVVTLHKVLDNGHDWPNNKVTMPAELKMGPTSNFPASEAIMNFFQSLN